MELAPPCDASRAPWQPNPDGSAAPEARASGRIEAAPAGPPAATTRRGFASDSAAGHRLAGRAIVKDEISDIRRQMQVWVDDPDVDIVVSTGGTGFTPRDVTPEAVMPLLRRVMDGFSVVFHQASLGTIGISTLQSRAFAGQAEDTFIFCLPGSTGACRDGWDLVLGLEFDSRYRPCSIAGQVPRLRGVCA